MNLKRQLLIISLFTLILPWAGCEFIRETESALRVGQQQMLSGTARAIAESMQQYAADFPTQSSLPDSQLGEQLYGHTLYTTPTVDGYFDDWALGPDSFGTLQGLEGPINFVTGVVRSQLYLFVKLSDRNVVYRQPGGSFLNQRAPFADQIILTSRTPSNSDQAIVFSAEAPGIVVARRMDSNGFRTEPLIRAVWQDVPGGVQLEARIPRSILGSHLGLSVDNTAAPEDEPIRQSTFNSRYPGRFMTHAPQIQAVTQSVVQPGMRLRVTDADGWRIADAGEILRRSNADAASSWLRVLYGALVEDGIGAAFAEADPTGQERLPYVRSALDGNPSASWFRSATGGTAIVSVAEPVVANGRVIGSIILQQGTDEILSLTNKSLSRLINVTLTATVVVAFLLLGYATWLSRRIGKLSVAAELALESDQLGEALPSNTSSDEIGDLSRSFSNVLVQLKDYNEYLRTLASKLSHELRTPLAIVTSSLENLEHEQLDASSARYTARARDGADRLRKILAAMSEASRVEELMRHAEPERVDLAKLIAQAVSAYRDVYPDRRFVVDSESPLFATLSPELIVQMLDKLVDNAVDFSAPDDTVSLSLTTREGYLVLSVYNPGPPLPDAMRDRLFDSMVSVRRDDSDEHLGLGLYIARIVVEGHKGTIDAENTDNGVRFVVELPWIY